MNEDAASDAVSRRRFLLRTLAVAGGVAAVPAVLQATGACDTMARAEPLPDDDAAVLGRVSENDLRAVTDNILCEGKCGKTVYTGELADGCSIAVQMKMEAARYLDQGMTPPQVLDQFAADFGEDVLAAPPKDGLNLIPWLLPVAGLGAGAVALARAVAHWQQQAPPPSAPVEPSSVDPETQARIDEEVARGL